MKYQLHDRIYVTNRVVERYAYFCLRRPERGMRVDLFDVHVHLTWAMLTSTRKYPPRRP